MTMSSLVQRQSERQGIFLIALSPFKRGAGGVKYQPYPFPARSHPYYPPIFSSLSYSGLPGNPGKKSSFYPPPETFSKNSPSLKTQGGSGWVSLFFSLSFPAHFFCHPRPIFLSSSGLTRGFRSNKLTMSSLVQRQSERQGIFLIALSPFKRGAGGANISLTSSP